MGVWENRCNAFPNYLNVVSVLKNIKHGSAWMSIGVEGQGLWKPRKTDAMPFLMTYMWYLYLRKQSIEVRGRISM